MSGELTPELLRRRPPPVEETELHRRLARSTICGPLDTEAQRNLVLTRVWEGDEDPLLTAKRQRRQVTTGLVVAATLLLTTLGMTPLRWLFDPALSKPSIVLITRHSKAA